MRAVVCLFLPAVLALITGCEDQTPVRTSDRPAAGGTSSVSSSGPDVDTLRARLEDPRVQVRLDACTALADRGDDPLVVPALYLRLADEAEDPAVKLAAVNALTTIGGGTVTKTLHAFFYGRPAYEEAWMVAGDWLVGAIGARQIADDLTGMSGREDYDQQLVLDFALRHPDEPPLRAVVERLR